MKQNRMIKQVNKPSVTIAIPAYNEERNIENILNSLLSQNDGTFIFEKIAVYSDGSTDRTLDIVRNIAKRSPLVRIVETEIRQGKMYQLNRIFMDFTSDFLVVLDADIGIEKEDFLDIFVGAAIRDPRCQMFAAHQVPLRPHTFIGRVCYAAFFMWDCVRLNIPGKDHVQNFYGAATLYRRQFAKSLHIPDKATESRAYLYMMAKLTGGFRYVDRAVVTYWPPNTLADFYTLRFRSFGSVQTDVEKALSVKLKNIDSVPWKYKFLGIIESFKREPFFTLPALLLSTVTSKIVKRKYNSSALWEIVESTKIPISAIDKKKNIIISSYDSLNNPFYAGGGAIAVHEVGRRLANYFNVTVLTMNYTEATNGYIDNVYYHHIGPRYLGPRIGQLVYHFLLPLYAIASRYELWIESFTPPFSTSFTPLFAKKPVIGLVHMLAAKDMERKYRVSLHFIEKLGLKFYKNIIALTQQTVDAIKACNSDARIYLICNGVDFPLEANEPGGGKQISFLGRIDVGQKGIDLLLEAYSAARNDIEIPLVIAGTGQPKEMNQVKELVKKYGLNEKVKLLGRVCGSDKEKFLRSTMIGIFPSRYETLSLSALEMMSHGIPIITFSIDSFAWVPNQALIRVTPFDSHELSKALVNLAKDEGLRKVLSHHARRFTYGRDWENVAERYREVIEGVLDENSDVQ